MMRRLVPNHLPSHGRVREEINWSFQEVMIYILGKGGFVTAVIYCENIAEIRY